MDNTTASRKLKKLKNESKPFTLFKRQQTHFTLKLAALSFIQVLFSIIIIFSAPEYSSLFSTTHTIIIIFLLVIGLFVTGTCHFAIGKLVSSSPSSVMLINCLQIFIHCVIQIEFAASWNQSSGKVLIWCGSAFILLLQLLLEETESNRQTRLKFLLIITLYIMIRSFTIEGQLFFGLIGPSLCQQAGALLSTAQNLSAEDVSLIVNSDRNSSENINVNKLLNERQLKPKRSIFSLTDNNLILKQPIIAKRSPEEIHEDNKLRVKELIPSLINDGLIIFNGLEEIIYYNEFLEQMFGPSTDFLNKLWTQMIQKKKLERPIDRNTNIQPLKRDLRTFKSGCSISPRSFVKLDESKSYISYDTQKKDRSFLTIKSSYTEKGGRKINESIGALIQKFKKEILLVRSKSVTIKKSSDEGCTLPEAKIMGTTSFCLEYLQDFEKANSYVSQIYNLEIIMFEKKANDINANEESKQSELEEIYMMLSFRRLRENEAYQLMKDFEMFRVRLLSTISHELRTPLNCSINMLEMLELKVPEEDDDKLDLLKPALNSCKLLLSNINDVLDYSSMLSNDFLIKPSRFSLKEILVEAINLIAYSARERSNAIVLEYDTEIPEKIMSDPWRIKQVLINLLMNANKYTVKGNILIRARVCSFKSIKIIVKDDGTGIKNETIKSIGVLSFQNEGNLIGLGLTISNYIAKFLAPKLKSGILVRTKEGKGSQFSFYLENLREISTKYTTFTNSKASNVLPYKNDESPISREDLISKSEQTFKEENLCPYELSQRSGEGLDRTIKELANNNEKKFFCAIKDLSHERQPRLSPPKYSPEKIDFQEFFPIPLELKKFMDDSGKLEILNENENEDQDSSEFEGDKGCRSGPDSDNSGNDLGLCGKESSANQRNYLVLSNCLQRINFSKNFSEKTGSTLLPYIVNETKTLTIGSPKRNTASEGSYGNCLKHDFTLGDRIESVVLKPCIDDQNEETASKQTKDITLDELKKMLRLKFTCDCPEILLVDDSGYNLMVLRKIVESLGLRVDCANSGEEAISLVQKYFLKCSCGGFRIILMDLDMPIKDGITTTREIIEFYTNNNNLTAKPSHVIACTAFSETEFGEKCKGVGMKGYICKPVKKALLEELLIKHLSKFV